MTLAAYVTWSFRLAMVKAFEKMARPFSASFSFIFVFFTSGWWTLQTNLCRRLDSNHGSLVSEATTLPTVLQPFPAVIVHINFYD